MDVKKLMLNYNLKIGELRIIELLLDGKINIQNIENFGLSKDTMRRIENVLKHEGILKNQP